MKVYLLTEGDYPDYQVTAVYENEEDAKKDCDILSKKLSLPDYYRVEEYGLIQKGEGNITISNKWLKCEYDFLTKETYVSEDFKNWGDRITEYNFRNGTQKIVYRFYKPSNKRNLLRIDKIISEKTKQLEHELNVLKRSGLRISEIRKAFKVLDGIKTISVEM